MSEHAPSSDPPALRAAHFSSHPPLRWSAEAWRQPSAPRGIAHAASDDTIKIGLIGCGGRGTGAASQALNTKGNVKLVAMGDAFKDRLESSLQSLQKEGGIANRIDVPEERRFVGFDAYKQVLDAGVDLVILATPPGFRPIHFEAAVDAGKHVFMEKPVAVDAPGVRAVLAAAQVAQQKNLAVGVGLQRHHEAAYIETIKRLQDGAIGDIVATRVYWNGAGVWVHPKTEGQTEMEYQMRNWYYFNWLCGDHIVEQHIHNLDVINWLKRGYPVKAEGMGGRQVRTGKDYGEIFDHHAVEFEYADGTRLFSHCRHIPNCWDSVSEHAQRHARHRGHQRRPDQGQGLGRLALPRREAATRTRSSTTICSPASAPARRSTRRKTARCRP